MKTFTLLTRILLLWGVAIGLPTTKAQDVSPTPVISSVPADPVSAADRGIISPTPAPVPPVSTEDERAVPQTDTQGTLRRLDTAPEGTPNVPGRSNRRGSSRRQRSPNDRVSVLGENHVTAGEHIVGDVVSVLGDTIVDGDVAQDTVCVFGDCSINGTVHGQVVCVFGDVHLGPQSHVMEDVVSIGGGDIARAAGAIVDGRIIHKAANSNIHIGIPLHAWWTNALGMGRPLAVAHGLKWLWVTTFFLLGFYVLLAVMFPVGIRRTGDMLVQRPVAVVFSAMLTTLALPVLFILLCVTVVGIPVALLVLPLSLILAVLFGKAAIYSWIGRRVTQDRSSLPLAVLLGGLLFTLLYLVPVVGITLWFVLGGLGLGCAVTAMFQRQKKPVQFVAAPAVAPAFVPPPQMSHGRADSPTMPGEAADESIPPATSIPPTSVPPVSSPSFTPAPPVIVGTPAGFWIRTGALLIDFVLCAVIFGAILHVMQLVFLALAAYGAVMWKFKEATIGGIICGLRVVRMDGKPLDWTTTIVRALGCFVSMLIVGLGFVWVAFDDEKQSWHDKIAGTTVVRAPRGTSLV